MNPPPPPFIEPELRKASPGGVTPSKNEPAFVFNDGDHVRTPRYLPHDAPGAIPPALMSSSTTSSHTINETSSVDSDRRNRTHGHFPPLRPPIQEQYPQYTIELLPHAYRIRGGNGNVVEPPPDLQASITKSMNSLRADTITEEWRKVLRDIFDLREQMDGQRALLSKDRRDSTLQRGYLTALQRDFMNASTTLIKSVAGISADPAVHLPLLVVWDQLQQAYDRATQLEKRYQDREKGLELLDRDLRDKEAQLFEGGHDPAHYNFPMGPDGPPRGYDQFDSVSVRTASTSPLEADYYDRVGDIHLIRERLFNFEAEHRRQVAIRDLHLKAGHEPDPPDSTFYETYFQQRGELIREYATADRDVQYLKEECQKLGLQVEEPNLPPFDEAYALDQSRRRERSISNLNLGSLEDRYDIDNRARVAVWLSNVRKVSPIADTDSVSKGHKNVNSTGLNSATGQLEKSPLVYECDEGLLPSLEYDPFQSTVATEVPDELEDTTSPTKGSRLSFQDPPQRRYSEPFPSATRNAHETGAFAILCKSCREAKTPRSVR